MHVHSHVSCTGMFVLTLALAMATASAQVTPPPPPGTPQAKVAPGERYDAGAFRRFLLGDTYRDLWTTPITVPVLDLHTYAGGLKPYKIGGGKQTKSLRFKNPDGFEYVFRLVDKEQTNPPVGWEHTLVDWIARDQVSSHHPAGAVVSDTLLALAGVVHPSPMLAVMPDDPALGEFRKEFAGFLGFIEPYPNMTDEGEGFAGAFEIIESESLLVLINANPKERVDAHAYLTSRLIDMFVNDWDRHAGNYKWAKLSPDGPWVPITRDRDKVLQGYGGIVPLGGKVAQQLVAFEDEYPHMSALTVQSRDMDRRILADLEKSEFDSIGVYLKSIFSDDVIEAALHRMPKELYPSIPETEHKLKIRRDAIPTETMNFYEYLKDDIDIHATDAPEHATVVLADDHHVDVEIRGANAPQPFYCRRFHTAETREIRLYMHGGDDRVEVSGNGAPHMDVRIIGGDGANNITDTSRIAPHSDEVKIYDHGRVSGTVYGPLEEEKPKEEAKSQDADEKSGADDAEEEKKDPDEDDVDPDFDRRPWYEHAYRVRDLPRDYGANTTPVGSLKAPGDLGLVLGFGLEKTRWGFRKWPYSSRMRALGEYSTKVGGWRATLFGDKRMENEELHFSATARMSELEVLNFYGYGNDTPGGPEALFEVRQRQWQLFPVIAYQVGTRSDFMLGPIAKYSTTDDIAGTFLTTEQPYGYGDFAQGGVRLALLSDSRDHSRGPGRKILLDLSASWYPPIWDVTEPFAALAAITATYITLPFLPLDPILALKAGGRMLIGDVFPFHEAAFIGGRPSERDLPRERYAGDQSVYGTAELRIPIVQFALLLPWDFGVYLWSDAGRVYLDGDSPGGWHEAAGAGMWLGILSPATTLSVEGDSAADVLRFRLGLSF